MAKNLWKSKNKRLPKDNSHKSMATRKQENWPSLCSKIKFNLTVKDQNLNISSNNKK